MRHSVMRHGVKQHRVVVRPVLVALAGTSVALVLAGCGTAVPPAGSVATQTTAAQPTQRSLTTPFPTITPVTPTGNLLTAGDTGATVTVSVGQRLTVELSPGPGAYAWDRPGLTGSGLQLESVVGGYPVRNPVRAVYLATGPGTAVLSAGSDAPCLHLRPRCTIAQRVWTIRVIVQSHP